MDRGLTGTTSLWPLVRTGFDFVHRAAHIFGNPKQQRSPAVRRRYRALLRDMRHHTQKAGQLKTTISHFLKVTESYWPGLFHCYDVPDLPRTNNDLEQLFGSARHHERRCTGRKAASPSLVLRGSVRIVAGLGTRRHSFRGSDLSPANLATWQTLRASLETRRHTRVLRQRFRRNPEVYLHHLEALLLKRILPP